MKKISSFFVALLLMTPWISASTAADGFRHWNDPSIERLIVKMEQVTEGNNFNLKIANLQRFETTITLTDPDGVQLDKQQISDANARQFKYTLRDVADGSYKLTINWNNQKISWLLYKKGKSIEFKKESIQKS